MKTTLEFLEQDLYLPGWMTLLVANYDGSTMNFDFHPAEPKVTRGDIKYFTPRGMHITLSQAGYCLAERTAETAGLIEPGELRDLLGDFRLKIVELNQRFRREIKLADILQGRIELTRLRGGRVPVMHMSFDFGSRAITGEMTGMIAPKPQPQMNEEYLRKN